MFDRMFKRNDNVEGDQGYTTFSLMKFNYCEFIFNGYRDFKMFIKGMLLLATHNVRALVVVKLRQEKSIAGIITERERSLYKEDHPSQLRLEISSSKTYIYNLKTSINDHVFTGHMYIYHFIYDAILLSHDKLISHSRY
nr:hypothetical protein [Tanacetum cinerariifolium]